MGLFAKCDECGKEQAVPILVVKPAPYFEFTAEIVPADWLASPDHNKFTMCCSEACAAKLTSKEGLELQVRRSPFREDLN